MRFPVPCCHRKPGGRFALGSGVNNADGYRKACVVAIAKGMQDRWITIPSRLSILTLHGTWTTISNYRKYQVRKKGILPIEEAKAGLSLY
jgi:hypothetical protein